MLVFLLAGTALAAELPAERLERNQELLDQDKLLMEKLNTEERVFVKSIVFKGDNSVPSGVLFGLFTPYEGHWLTDKEMRQIIRLITEEYRKAGKTVDSDSFVFRVEGGILEITASTGQ
jgi:outer membrane protein assembly factor BamA